MIVADRVTCRVGRRALLEHVCVTVEPGEVLAVVGPNGAGKSTLLRALAGEARPSAGEVRFEGHDIARLAPLALARRRAVVGQHVAIGFPMQVQDVVALGRLPWHATPEMADDVPAVARAMTQAGVAHLAKRAYATLSGGERQRVQVARALAQLHGAAAPAALLLDEPTSSLDAGHRAQLLRLLRRLAGRGVAVLAVLHDLNETAFVADRVAMLAEGRLIAAGRPADVLETARLESVYGLPFRMLPDGDVVPIFGADR